MYYIYGPAALIFIFPSFWVRLGAAETMNVSHVRVNVGCASYVDFPDFVHLHKCDLDLSL